MLSNTFMSKKQGINSSHVCFTFQSKNQVSSNFGLILSAIWKKICKTKIFPDFEVSGQWLCLETGLRKVNMIFYIVLSVYLSAFISRPLSCGIFSKLNFRANVANSSSSLENSIQFLVNISVDIICTYLLTLLGKCLLLLFVCTLGKFTIAS